MDDLAISLEGTPTVRKFVNLWTCAMLGVTSIDVSAIYFLHYCRSGGGLLQMRSDGKGGGQHLRFRDGTQTLSTGIRRKLRPGSMHISTRVAQIKQDLESGCTVTTRDGRVFYNKKVVCTVPSTLLTDISISPPLSADKQWLISESHLGFYAKVHLVYQEPWWREAGFCGLSQGMRCQLRAEPTSPLRPVPIQVPDFRHQQLNVKSYSNALQPSLLFSRRVTNQSASLTPQAPPWL